jgi:chloride channel 7
MKPFASLKIYPRPDNEYKNKSSLDFQRVLGNLYGSRPTGNQVQAYLWFLCLLIGFTMGSVAFLLDMLVEVLIAAKWDATEYVTRSTGSPMLGYVVIIFISLAFALVATSITGYIAPAALGSGVAETMGILNGVKY